MNYFRVDGALFAGIQAIPVRVECAQSRRLPYLQIIGGSGNAASELRERVIAALDACKIRLPARRVTVQFHPGAHGFSLEELDLAVAVAILGSCGLVPVKSIEGLLICGGLGLDGSLRPVTSRSALKPILRNKIFKSALLAWDDSVLLTEDQARLGGGFRHLLELLEFLKGNVNPGRKTESDSNRGAPEPAIPWRLFQGQEVAKRVMEVAAAGAHHILLFGPNSHRPELFASVLSSMLPSLSGEEEEEVRSIYSLAGLDQSRPARPFCHFGNSPGLPPLLFDRKLGKIEEILLAHRGVLFLDRVTERSTDFMRLLHDPMQRGSLLARFGARRGEVPLEMLVVAHGTHCGCGARGDRQLPCTCRPTEVRRYQQRQKRLINYPFDLGLSLEAPPASADPGRSWEQCRQSVAQARERMRARQGKPNSRLIDSEIFAIQSWSEGALSLWEVFRRRLSGSLSARTLALAKLSLTICDLREGAQVSEADLLEAKHYFGAVGGGEGI